MPADKDKPTTAVPSRRRRWLFRAITLLFGLVVAFAIAEIVVRRVGVTDADGNFFYNDMNRPIGAINPPVESLREKLERYETSHDTRMIYDADTGWSPRPDSESHKGMYRYDSNGIRTAGGNYATKPKPGVTRIAIFGDSFAHSDDVPFEKSWGYHLETKVAKTEVINFGVSAYGMDQAFLRWKTLGKGYSPKIVLFGFQAENINRNVNLFRGFYMIRTGIPFSKPRFVLNESGRLRVINRPTLPLDRIVDVMADMSHWPLAKHEWFYNPHDFRRQWWHRSRFISLAVDRITNPEARDISRAKSTLDLDGEPVKVTLQMLREFREEVEAAGGRFYVVHLPKKSDIQRLLKNYGLTYARIWQAIEKTHHTVDPLSLLLPAAQANGVKPLYAAPNHAHFSDAGNRMIADAIQRKLVADGVAKP